MLATVFERPGEEFPQPQNSLNGHASVLQYTNFSLAYPSSAYVPYNTNNDIILRLTRRLRRQTLSIPDHTRVTRVLHCCRSSAVETTTFFADASMTDRRLLPFSLDSCTEPVLG
jgi:hypothetical protein